MCACAARVDQAMLDQDFEGRFATTILAHVILRGGVCECTIATAGHPAGLVRRAGGEVEELGDSGTLLGVFPDPVIPDVSTTLSIGGVTNEGLTPLAPAIYRFYEK